MDLVWLLVAVYWTGMIGALGALAIRDLTRDVHDRQERRRKKTAQQRDRAIRALEHDLGIAPWG